MSCLKLICRYFPCSHTKRTDWVTLTPSCREAPHRKICQCKKWHILTELKYLLLFSVVFPPSSLLIRGKLLTLLNESGQWDAGSLNGDTKVPFWQRMKLNTNPLSCGLAVTLRATGRVAWSLCRVESSSMCFLPSFLPKPALWVLFALFLRCFGLSGFPELTIMASLLKWRLSITQCKTWYYRPAYKNGLLPSFRAFINYVQKYSKVVANSLDWFWLHKRQVISNYEN